MITETTLINQRNTLVNNQNRLLGMISQFPLINTLTANIQNKKVRDK